MRRKWNLLLMGLCLHIVLSGFLLGLFTVYRSGYDRTHREPVEPASLRVTGNTATLTVLSQPITVTLPEDTPAGRVICFALADGKLRLCAVLLHQFIFDS